MDLLCSSIWDYHLLFQFVLNRFAGFIGFDDILRIMINIFLIEGFLNH